MVSGRGIKKYLSNFEAGNIKSGDDLVVKSNNGLENYYVNDDGSLSWANISTKKRLEKRNLKRNLDSIPA